MLSYEDYVQQQDLLAMERFIRRVRGLIPVATATGRKLNINCHSICQARKLAGMTQAELSERTGIAQGAISKIESGKANPSVKTLARLAEGLGMSVTMEFTPRTDDVSDAEFASEFIQATGLSGPY